MWSLPSANMESPSIDLVLWGLSSVLVFPDRPRTYFARVIPRCFFSQWSIFDGCKNAYKFFFLSIHNIYNQGSFVADHLFSVCGSPKCCDPWVVTSFDKEQQLTPLSVRCHNLSCCHFFVKNEPLPVLHCYGQCPYSSGRLTFFYSGVSGCLGDEAQIGEFCLCVWGIIRLLFTKPRHFVCPTDQIGS